MPLGGKAVARAEAYHRTKWHLDPSIRLATTNIGQKWELCPLFGKGDSLPPSPKRGYSPKRRRGTGSPSSTMWPGPLSVCPVCLSCPVSDVSVLWLNGLTDQDETWQAGRPRPWPHCVRWRPSYPSPKGAPPPIFSPYPLRPNGCIDQDSTWYGGRPRPGATLC